MSDLLDKVLSDQDPFKKILGKIPGFKGYIERQSRRDADKLLRETIASRFETLWQRISALQRDMISGGDLSYVDVLESAAIKLRTFADRIRSATYGYSSLFEAVKINEAELNKLYEYDLALLEYVDRIEHAINNIEASLGTDGLPAAVRALVSLARESIEAYDRREEVILAQ
jgi:hypothetical protein